MKKNAMFRFPCLLILLSYVVCVTANNTPKVTVNPPTHVWCKKFEGKTKTGKIVRTPSRECKPGEKHGPFKLSGWKGYVWSDEEYLPTCYQKVQCSYSSGGCKRCNSKIGVISQFGRGAGGSAGETEAGCATDKYSKKTLEGGCSTCKTDLCHWNSNGTLSVNFFVFIFSLIFANFM